MAINAAVANTIKSPRGFLYKVWYLYSFLDFFILTTWFLRLFNGNAVLKSLIVKGNVTAVKLALYAGSDVKMISAGDQSLLHLSADHNNEGAFLTVLENTSHLSNQERIDLIFKSDVLDRTAIEYVLENNQQKAMQHLVNAVSEIDLSAADESGLTLLHVATWLRNQALFDLVIDKISKLPLVERMSVLNAVTTNGSGAIHYAVNWNNQNTQRLLDMGANIQLANKHGETVLHLAALGGHDQIVKNILTTIKQDAEMTEAAAPTAAAPKTPSQNMAEVFKVCMKTDKNGSTPLQLAASNNHVKCINEQFAGMSKAQKAAMQQHKDKSGMTAFLDAVVAGNVAVATLLRQNGAHILAQNKHNETPLILSAKLGKKDVVIQLLKWIQNLPIKQQLDYINAKGPNGTALQMAASHKDPSIVDSLLKHIAILNLRALKPNLLQAVQNISPKKLPAQIKNKIVAVITKGDKENDAPVVIAQNHKRREVLNLFRDYGFKAPANWKVPAEPAAKPATVAPKRQPQYFTFGK